MLPRLNRRLTGLFCLILLAPLAGQAAPPAGRLLASQCAQCHGTDGRAVGDIDSLRGESAWELYEEMLEMKYGNESNDIMHYQARGYTEEQIHLIADYYASLSQGGGATGDRNEYEEHEEEHEEEHDD